MECDGAHHTGLYCIVMYFVYLGILPELYSKIFYIAHRNASDDLLWSELP